MNREEWKQYQLIDSDAFRMIHSEDFKEGILIKGYNLDRQSVILSNDRCQGFTLQIGDKIVYKNAHSISAEDAIPSKRAYPEECDYTCCVALRQMGFNIPFTTYPTELLKYKMFLDDIRNPEDVGLVNDEYVIVRDYQVAVDYMEKFGCPDYITFDHDLGKENAPTGYSVAKWMVSKDQDKKGKFFPKDFMYNVHSANPVGAENINKFMDNWFAFKSEMNYNV